MKELLIQIAAIIVAVVSVLLFFKSYFFWLQLAEYSWGGKYLGVLPKK